MSALRLRFRGPLSTLAESDRAALLGRSTAAAGPTLERVRVAVREIIARVRRDGDAALLALAREHDGAALTVLEVPETVLGQALDGLDPALRGALERAARNIETFHRAQLPGPIEIETEPGITLGRRADALARVGIYAPGGRASYPSSVLMAAIPARVAGVGEIILCSPPGASGVPSKAVLAAASLAGVQRVFTIGGAGAIAALAYGTASVPRVDRIVGPGNAYVSEAKLAVSGDVAIDSPAGPSEILVMADDSADPMRVARELLAQAEHDPLACSVAVAIGERVARAIEAALDELIASDPAYTARRAILLESLAAQGGILTAASRAQALAFANEYAAEHLMLTVADPASALAHVRAAGTVFLGDGASVAFGDYMSGANHVLPTGGFARGYSGLSTLDFMRWTTWQRISAGAAARLADDVALFAEAERLPAHAAAARAAGGVSGTGGAAVSRSASLPARDEGHSPVSRLLMHRYAALSLYAPNQTPCAVDLSDNTNAYGMPPAARRALREAARSGVTRYPSVYSDALRTALGRHLGVADDEIVTGCGSDDVLDSTLRAFTEPGDRVAYLDPTFGMVPVFARMNGLEPVPVSTTGDAIADAAALVATGARVLYLCSPNNPTGSVLDAAAFAHIVEHAPGLVILDQAYAEFVLPTTPHADASPGTAALGAGVPRASRLLVVRTMSKAFGLAGLRIGYGVGDRALIEAVAKARGPFKVSAPAERAGVAALTHDLDWVAERVHRIQVNRGRFARALRRLGFRVPPSQANFVLVPVTDARRADAALRARGVAVRPFVGLAGIGDALRITIGRGRDLETVRRALAELAPELGITPSDAAVHDAGTPATLGSPS